MRYLGPATLEPATQADQIIYSSCREWCEDKGLDWFPGLESNKHFSRGWREANQTVVAAVVFSSLIPGGQRRLRNDVAGNAPFAYWLETSQTQPLVLGRGNRDESLYFIREQLWAARDEEREEQPFAQFSLLICAAAIRRERDQERRLVEARMIVDSSQAASNFDTEIGGMEVPFQRRAIPDQIKMFVWQRDLGRCVNCGSNRDLEYDHVIPVSMGGANTARNLQLLCEPCNRRKGANIA